jgi:hypothetical protein
VKIGHEPGKFWEFTWYEWGMEMLRHYESQKQREEDREFYLSVKRIEIADFKNANWSFPGGKLKPRDIFKLSFDVPEQEERPLSFKEAKALFGSRIRRDGKQ